jgi:RNA recognition motif-containing protein
MEQREAADRAICAQDGQAMRTEHGKSDLKVKRYLSDGRLWVSDLSPYVTSDGLKEAFSQFGVIREAMVFHGRFSEKKLSQGWGWVQYIKRSAAVKVELLLRENMFIMKGSPKPIHVEFWESQLSEDAALAKTALEQKGVREVGFHIEMQVPPHMSQPNTLEFELGKEWRRMRAQHYAEKRELKAQHNQEQCAKWAESLKKYEQECDKLKRLNYLAAEYEGDKKKQRRN